MNYKGDVDSNGYLNGYCEIEYDSGDVYKGNMSRSKKDGYGELLFRNGDKYYGNFINDEMTGKGTIITSSYRYEGDLLRGRFDGQGKLVTSSMTYVGQFSNDKKDGYGELIQGQLRYVGFFKNDKFDGDGSLTDYEGEYQGSFKQGKFDGRGKLRFRNGDVYEGNWRNDTPEGYFKISSKDYTFEGNMSNGKKEGRGVIRYSNGEVVEGEFSDERLVKSYNQKEVKQVNISTTVKSSSPTYSSVSNNVIIDYSHVDKNSRFANEEAILESKLDSLYKNYTRRQSSIVMDFMKEAREEGKSYDNFVSYTLNICQVTRPNHKYRGECCGRDCYHGCGQLNEGDSYYYGQFNFHQKEGIGSYTVNKNFRIRGYFEADKVHGFAIVYLSDNNLYKGYFEKGRLKTDYIEYYKNQQLYFRGSVYDIALNGSIIKFKEGELFENNKVFKGVFVNNLKDHGELYIGSIKYVGKYLNGELDGEVDKYADNQVKKVLFKKGKELYALDEVKEIRRENYVYKGSLKDDKRHGYGECKYDDGGYYLGFWHNDCWHGEGFVKYNSGDEYTGLFNMYKREGYGEHIFKAGGFYKGVFYQDKYHGKGHFKYVDGNEYIGDFKNDKRDGFGEMKYADGGYYKGSWKDDFWHGQGYVKYNSGDEYTGEFKMYKRDGQGELKEKNGNYYKGGFKDNFWHGKGYCKYSDGTIYQGSYDMSNIHGYGECKYKSGIIYKGNWVNNRWEGFGEVYYSDGSSYKGMFENFTFKGQGEYISPSKEKYVGTFLNNLYDGYMKVYNQKGLLIYEGDYKAGKKHGVVKEYSYMLNGSLVGYTSYYYEEGNPCYIVEFLKGVIKTTGKFTLDKFIGFGNQYINDCLFYRGEFYCGNKSGRGIMFIHPTDDQEIIYDGDYFNGDRYGYVISTENNKTLKIYFKNNKPSLKKESSYLPSKKTLLEQDRTSFDFYRREYHYGFYSAMFKMGMCYLEGRNVEKNPYFAFKYFKDSAEYYPLSDIKLGICYLFGYGVDVDEKLAFKILSRYNDTVVGNNESLYYLAYCYEFGKGTKIDYKKAMFYYDLASSSETITFNNSIEYNRCVNKLSKL